jgi:hypothetical protein
MVSRIIETRAVISAEDKNTAATFTKIAKSFDGIVKTVKAFEGIKPSKAFDDMARSAKALEGVKPLAGWGRNFQQEIDRLKLSTRQLMDVQKSFARFQIKAPRFKATEFVGDLERWKRKTLRTLHEVRAAEEEAMRRRTAAGYALRRGFGFAAGAMGAGSTAYVVERGARTALEKSGEAQRELVRQQQAGMTPDEQREANETARRVSTRYPSVGPVEIQEHIRRLRSRFGDFHHAIGAIEDLVKAQVVLGNAEGADGAGSDLERLVLGLESVGAGADPAKFKSYLSSFVRAKQLFPDLKGEDFRQYLQNAKSSKYGLSDEYLQYVAPTMMQHEGAGKFGTAQATAFSSLVGARTTPRSAEELYRLGLIAKEDLITDSHGTIKGFKKIIDENKFVANPYRYAQENLQPALAAKGITLADKEQFVATITKAFSSRNAGEFFTSLLVNKGVIDKDAGMLRGLPSIDAADDVQRRDPFIGFRAVREQMFGFFQALGGPEAEKAAGVLNSIAQGIAKLSEVATKDESIRKDAATGGLLAMLTGTAGGAAWLSSILPKEGLTALAARGITGLTGVGAGLGLMIAWHAAGAEKRRELIEEYKRTHPALDKGATAALSSLNAIDDWQSGLNRSGLGGAFREAQLKKIGAARSSLQPTLEALGYGPEWLANRGYDKPLTIEAVRQALGMDRGSSVGRVTGEVHGEAQVTIKVEPSSDLLRIVNDLQRASVSLSGTIAPNGPGSLGVSSPDAAAAPIGTR